MDLAALFVFEIGQGFDGVYSVTYVSINDTVYPGNIGIGGTTGTEATLNAVGEKVAFIVDAPAAGDVDRISFGVGNISANGNVDVDLFAIDATTGHPTGASLAGTTHAFLSTDDNVIIEATLDASYTTTKGQRLAVVLELQSVVNMAVNGWSLNGSFQQCYMLEDTGGGWGNGTRTPGVSFRYGASTGWLVPGGSWGPAPGALNTSSFNANSTPDEIGLVFSVPFACKICGFRFLFENDSDDSLKFKLYDTDGTTVLETLNHDKDERATTSLNQGDFRFTSEHTLTAGSDYRITMAPTATSGTMRLSYFEGVSDALADSIVRNWRYTSQTNAGGFSESGNEGKIPRVGIYISQIDDGTGSGGGGDPTGRQGLHAIESGSV